MAPRHADRAPAAERPRQSRWCAVINVLQITPGSHNAGLAADVAASHTGQSRAEAQSRIAQCGPYLAKRLVRFRCQKTAYFFGSWGPGTITTACALRA